MDEIVTYSGLNNNCTYCGVLRRQAMERGAILLGASKLILGHNADDLAETVLMNILRGDWFRYDSKIFKVGFTLNVDWAAVLMW